MKKCPICNNSMYKKSFLCLQCSFKTRKGVPKSAGHKVNIKNALLGRKITWSNKMKGSRPNMRGSKNPAFGKKRPDLVLYNKTIKPGRFSLGIKKSESHKAALKIAHKLSHNTPECREKLRINRLKQHFPTKETSIEKKIYEKLKERNIPFIKHKSILNMTQPDAFIPPNICIYADGKYWHSLPEVIQRDKRINEELPKKGYVLLRYSENQINNSCETCIDDIEKHYFSGVEYDFD